MTERSNGDVDMACLLPLTLRQNVYFISRVPGVPRRSIDRNNVLPQTLNNNYKWKWKLRFTINTALVTEYQYHLLYSFDKASLYYVPPEIISHSSTIYRIQYYIDD